MLLHRECENKGVTCNKLATAISQSSENKISHKFPKRIIRRPYDKMPESLKKHNRHHRMISYLTCNTDITSRITYWKAISSLIPNSILWFREIKVTSGWGTHGSSQMSGNYATWAVQLVCNLRKAYVPRRVLLVHYS